ncbi:MAG TPA: hypothetical protein VFQ00_00240 [Terriglobales bacterium]|nr:hypothetical protein [Terriglobales bacterium]
MSYQASKPFGRRRTDRPLEPEESEYLQSIRRDVEQDESGLLRRYMRLSGKALHLTNESESKKDEARHTADWEAA